MATHAAMMENAPVPQPVQNIHIHMDTVSFLGVPVDVISIIATLTVGLVQVGVILWGLYQMQEASKTRNKQLDKQHEVQIGQLNAQMEQLVAQKQQLDAQDRKTDILIENLRIQGQALQNLIERIAPPPPERTQA